MKHVSFSDLEWTFLEKHDCFLGMHPDLPGNKHADVAFVKIEPQHTLTPHFHIRPDDGYETLFFFQGGHFEVVGEEGVRESFEQEEPLYLHFYSNDPHGIRNLGKQDLFCEVECAPAFDPEEEQFI